MQSDLKCVMGTLARQLESAANLDNPNVVKVALAQNGNALYFSGAGSVRSGRKEQRCAGVVEARSVLTNIWGSTRFRREFLLKFVQLPQSELKKQRSWSNCERWIMAFRSRY